MMIALSLVGHATVFLPMLLSDEVARPAQREVPVELVREVPKPPEKAPPPAKPPETQATRQPAKQPPAPEKQKPPQAPAKQATVKQAPPKPAPAKQVAQKQPQKPSAAAARKATAQEAAAPKPEPKPARRQIAQTPPESPSERLKDLLGSMPGEQAVALPGASAEGTEAVSYPRLVLSQVAKAKKQGVYPGIPGAASVAFTVGDAGQLARIVIERPSGIASLDAEAIAMIKRGAPYPPPPPGARRDYVITLRFGPVAG